MSFAVPSRKVAALAAAGSGLAAVLLGALTPATAAPPTTLPTAAPVATAAPSPGADWFVDPLSPAERRALLAVPADPKHYVGKVRQTRAVYRTKSGRLAVPLRSAFGHQLGRHQAVTLDGSALFAVNSTRLTDPARARLARLAAALDDAAAVRCEGYSDYAGAAARNRALAEGRAAAVCRLLASQANGLATTTVSFGPRWPAVVGGDSDARRLNRRVVVEVTRMQPPPPVAPQAQVPGPPELLYVSGWDNRVYYAFNAPQDDGGSPVTGYEVSTGAGWTAVQLDLGRSAVRGARGAMLCRGCGDYYASLPGVPNGSTVGLQVRAVNAIGAGAPSETLSTTVHGSPSAPTDLQVEGGHGTITATWGAPADDGGSAIEAYYVSFDGGFTWQGPLAADATSASAENLPAGTHTVFVQAVNGWGGGASATKDVDVLDSTQPIVNLAYWNGSDTVYVEHYQGTVAAVPSDYQASVDGGPWVDIASYGSDPATDDRGRRYFGSFIVPACSQTPQACNQLGSTVRVRAIVGDGYSKPSGAVEIWLPA